MGTKIRTMHGEIKKGVKDRDEGGRKDWGKCGNKSGTIMTRTRTKIRTGTRSITSIGKRAETRTGTKMGTTILTRTGIWTGTRAGT